MSTKKTGHENPYRRYDCFKKISIVLTNLQRLTGQQPFPEQLRAAQEGLRALDEYFAKKAAETGGAR